MPASRTSPVVVGIDVGGRRKGFHAVALEDGRYRDRLATTEVSELATWGVKTLRATVIAVDAPCRWSPDGRMRPCECELIKQGIFCFATPTLKQAENHPSDYYGWMLRGAALVQALELSHPLLTSLSCTDQHSCFETFPHAITWHLRGGDAQAHQKRPQRQALLQQAGINITPLTSIDLIDAALCALTAHHLASSHPCRAYGEPSSGLIVVPEVPG
jgi:predicted nuclease with RNAse H fold